MRGLWNTGAGVGNNGVMYVDPDSEADEIPVGRLRDHAWLIRFGGVVGLFALITIVWSYVVDVPIRDPGGSMFLRRVLLSIGLFAALAVVDAALRLGRGAYDPRALVAKLRQRWSSRRLALAAAGLLGYHLVYLLYHNIKSWVVFMDVQDEGLLRLDNWMMFGHSPAVLLHDLLGQHTAAIALAIVYEAFSYLVTLSFVSALVFANRIRDGYVYVTSAIWAWILGAFAYYMIPTLGPFASAPQEFSGLTRTFINSRQDNLLADREYLISNPAAPDAFASIGAFASLHVGFTFMMLLMLRYYGFRRATHAMTIFLFGTIVATIYFGYHYIIDDIAGLALGWSAVALGKWVIYPKSRSRPVAVGELLKE